jgi:hypothetical protein
MALYWQESRWTGGFLINWGVSEGGTIDDTGVCLGCLPQMEGAGSLDTMSFPYLSHCLCSIARGFAGVGGVDVAWLWMPTSIFGLSPALVELVFALLRFVCSIQELPQCM